MPAPHNQKASAYMSELAIKGSVVKVAESGCRE